LEQSGDKNTKTLVQIGHENFFKYPFSQNTRRVRFHGKRTEKEMVYFKIKDLIDEGITSTGDLALRLGKSTRQTRRYLKKMARLRMVKLDSRSGRLLKEGINYRSLSKDRFSKIPEISKWIDDCIARQIAPRTIMGYVQSVRYILGVIRKDPKKVIASRGTAIEYWTKFIVAYKKQFPSKGTRNYRVSYRNFLASFDIIFPTRMGKIYGLSSAHDNSGSYAGICFSARITEELGRLMLQANDIELYTWFRVGLRTGARSRSIAKMTWDRIYFHETNPDGTESFKLEQHETKDPHGQWYLGENGEWKTKYPPLDLKKLLLEWKEHSPVSNFLWFEDGGSDAQNSKNASRFAAQMSIRLKPYYEKISSQVDSRTREFMFKRPAHMLRHTLAQQLRDAGLTSEEIADSFGWKTPHIVSTWYAKTSEKKRKELGMRCSRVIF
jgi:integrase